MEDINQDGIDIHDIIKKYGLDKDYKVGEKISNMLQRYKGNVTYPITEQEKERIERLGLLAKDKDRVSSLSEKIRILEILQSEGVIISKIPAEKMERGKRVSTTIEDIAQTGIDIYEIINKHGLDKKYKIGFKIANIVRAYKEDDTITEEEKRRIIGVGTTSCRVLETNYRKYNKFVGEADNTNIFIYNNMWLFGKTY